MAYKGMWESEIEGLWLKARSEVHSPYGCWQTRAAFVPKGDSPEPQLVAVWQVVDLDGTVILTTKHEHMAKLASQIPELVDAELRPGQVPTYVVDDNGRHMQIPAAPGLTHVDDAYDTGYSAGFQAGQEQAESEADHDDDNCSWTGTDGEHLPKEVKAALRAHPGEPS